MGGLAKDILRKNYDKYEMRTESNCQNIIEDVIFI
jgi:hypothetical protein